MNQNGVPRWKICLVLLTKGLKTKITKAPATSATKTSRIIIKNCVCGGGGGGVEIFVDILWQRTGNKYTCTTCPDQPHLQLTCQIVACTCAHYPAICFLPACPRLTQPEPDLLLSLLPGKPACLLSLTTRLSNPVSACVWIKQHLTVSHLDPCHEC